MDKKKNENFFLKLVKIKKEIRNCVQNGRDLKDVEKTMVSDSLNPYNRSEEVFCGDVTGIKYEPSSNQVRTKLKI